MTNIRMNRKPRKDGDLWTDKDGQKVFIGRDWALQNEIDETREKTQARGCFKGCRTCGACSNSNRDSEYHFSFDEEAGKEIDCRECEPFRFHDCQNGWMRDSRQEAEPFTPEVIKLLDEAGGKPLI